MYRYRYHVSPPLRLVPEHCLISLDWRVRQAINVSLEISTIQPSIYTSWQPPRTEPELDVFRRVFVQWSTDKGFSRLRGVDIRYAIYQRIMGIPIKKHTWSTTITTKLRKLNMGINSWFCSIWVFQGVSYFFLDHQSSPGVEPYFWSWSNHHFYDFRYMNRELP